MQQPYRPIPKVGPSKEELEAERLAVDAARRHREAQGFGERLAHGCTLFVVAVGAIWVLSALISHDAGSALLRVVLVVVAATSMQGATFYRRSRAPTPWLVRLDETPRDYRAPFVGDASELVPSGAEPTSAEQARPQPPQSDAITRWTD